MELGLLTLREAMLRTLVVSGQLELETHLKLLTLGCHDIEGDVYQVFGHDGRLKSYAQWNDLARSTRRMRY